MIVHLSVEDVLEVHELSIEKFGGSHGLRDRSLLESAIAQPQASFGGELLHPSLGEMATAYLFHIVSNHPFVDGNKRTGLGALLVFLHRNGIRFDVESDRWYDVTISIAEGRANKSDVTEQVRRLIAESGIRF